MENREAMHHLIELYDNLEKFFSQMGYHLKDEYTNARTLAIAALEKQEQDRWIPCSVRLPENKKRVLVSYDTKDGKKVDISMFDKYGCLLGHVSAWRPLPEPYQEDKA